MRLTWKDAAATAFTAAIVGAWAAYATGSALPGLSGPRAVSGVTLLLGLGACGMSGAGDADAQSRDTRAGAVLGAAAMVVGILALVTGSELLLAALVGLTVLLWAMTTLRHLVASSHRMVRRTP